MGAQKKYIPKRKEKQPVGKDFVCFYSLVIESSKLGPIEFVMIGKNEQKIKVHIEHGTPTTINGKEYDKGQMLDFIAKAPSDFEGLFLQVMKKKYDSDLHIMPKLHLAKLTDMAGLYGKQAVVEIYDGKKTRKLKIERTGADGCYYLDTVKITKEEAVKFIESNYGNFLVSKRKAVKDLKGHNSLINKYPAYYKSKKPEVKHSEIVDGKLQVDIDSFLPKPKAKEEGDKIMKKGEAFMKTTKRGYIED